MRHFFVTKCSYTLALSILLIICQLQKATAQLTVTPGQTAATLAAALSGPGVTITNPVLTCPSAANGLFTVTGTTLSMTNGILLTTGHSVAAAGAEPPLVSFANGAPGDADMAPFLPAGANTFDACILEFDVVPIGDTISFGYQFGSEEYRTAVCSDFTDIFAFFISGPGIAGTQNLALVPGTTIPVEINSINNGTPGTVPSAAIGNCTSLGLGSPFTTYYIDNTGGTQLAYKGYTTKLKAIHAVTPCATYHLKLSIADAGNAIYDSGVFLEGGSLSSNAFRFSTVDSIGHTINGIPHTIIKGCDPATVTVLGSFPVPVPQTISIVLSGNAVNGVDMSTIPSSIVMPANALSTTFSIQGILNGSAGMKTATLYLTTVCGLSDSISIHIIDQPTATILTPDTTTCPGQPYQIRTAGTPGLTYSWTPATGLTTPTSAQPMATTMVNTTYTLTATMAGTGCPAITDTLAVTVKKLQLGAIIGDSVFCRGTYYTFDASNILTNDLMWSFGPGDTVKHTSSIIHAWDVAGTFTVVVSSVFAGCADPVSKVITVYAYPDIYLGADTGLCQGGQGILLHNANNSTAGLWHWNTGATTPTLYVSEPGTYFTTVSTNGCQAADTIVVANDCYVDVPNAFTPNGDGVNEYFFPRSLLTKGIVEFSMEIYNRWGQQLFATKSLDGLGWDGRVGGEMQPQGVFVYVINATMKDGQQFYRKGNVTLIR